MKAALLLTAASVLAAWSEQSYPSPQIVIIPVPAPRPPPRPIKTVSWFVSHPNDMARTLAICRENPGSMAAECQNARAAETRVSPPQWPSFSTRY